MSRLQKLIEVGSSEKDPTRAAYVLEFDKLPLPIDGMQWRLVGDFKAGDEILKHAGLKDVFKAAIRNGYAVVSLAP